MKVSVEATDEADAINLKKRLTAFLQKLDNGDYCGRDIWIE